MAPKPFIMCPLCTSLYLSYTIQFLLQIQWSSFSCLSLPCFFLAYGIYAYYAFWLSYTCPFCFLACLKASEIDEGIRQKFLKQSKTKQTLLLKNKGDGWYGKDFCQHRPYNYPGLGRSVTLRCPLPITTPERHAAGNYDLVKQEQNASVSYIRQICLEKMKKEEEFS